MDVFNRGIRLYLLVLAFVTTLAIVWGTNRFLLGNATAGTGWPLMVGLAGGFLLLGVIVRRRRATDDRNHVDDQYPWSSNER